MLEQEKGNYVPPASKEELIDCDACGCSYKITPRGDGEIQYCPGCGEGILRD